MATLEYLSTDISIYTNQSAVKPDLQDSNEDGQTGDCTMTLLHSFMMV